MHVKVAAYAASRGVSRNTVYRWIENEVAVLNGKLIDVAETDRRLKNAGLGRHKAPAEAPMDAETPPVTLPARDKSRRGVTSQRDKSADRPAMQGDTTPVSSMGQVEAIHEAPPSLDPAAGIDAAPVLHELDPEDLVQNADAFIQRVLGGQYETMVEAERIKQNALALKHVLDVHQKAGRLVNKEAVLREAFASGRAWRDMWLNWPSKIAPLLAADLGIEPDKLVGFLSGYVHKQVSELGDVELDLSEAA